MKLNKPVVKSEKISGTFIAIGTRGTSLTTEMPTLEGGLVLGTNPILKKERCDFTSTDMKSYPLWVRSCSWISRRQDKTFQLLKLEDALKKGEVVKLPIRFTAHESGKTYSGFGYFPKGTKSVASVRQPQNIAVQAPGWKFGRIEAKPVTLPGETAIRNGHLMGKLIVEKQEAPSKPKAEAKPATKAATKASPKAAKPEVKPVTRKEALAAAKKK